MPMRMNISSSFQGSFMVLGRRAHRVRYASPPKIFAEIVRKLPDNEIIIDTQGDNQALITGGKAKFKIASLPGDEFSYRIERK